MAPFRAEKQNRSSSGKSLHWPHLVRFSLTNTVQDLEIQKGRDIS